MRMLGGDVGGTKTLLRCIEEDGTVVLEGRYDGDDYVRFDDLLRAFLRDLSGPIDAACFAVAGPVRDGMAELTNRGWIIDERAIAHAFAIRRVAVVNDFHAVALGVPLLSPSDLVQLQPGRRDRFAPIAVLGAGTGLGQAVVLKHGGMHHVVPTEGGHGDFAPQDEEQARLFLHLHERLGHVSWERVVSGMGIESIYAFLGGGEADAADISTRADGDDAIARRTMEIFVDAYGSEAGNMALRTLSRGGVFLAGGIAGKNLEWFTDGRFVRAFRRKGRFSDLMEEFPVDLITNAGVGLLGALESARRVALA